MTAPAIDAEIAELDFDHTPACEGSGHVDTARPPAQLWVQMHDCFGAALCIPCQQMHADWVAQMLRVGMHIHCTGCRKAFTSYPTLVTQVVPI